MGRGSRREARWPTPVAGDQPGPQGRTTSAWELVQGRLDGPVPCLRTTRSTGEDRLRPGTRPRDPTGSWDSGRRARGTSWEKSELTGPPWPTWFTPYGAGVPSIGTVAYSRGWGPTRSTGEDHLRLETCPGEAGSTCPVPEDHQPM